MAFSKEDEAGTIYENTSKAGEVYLRMTINGQRFLAYRNKFKEQDRHPDWKVYIDKPREGGAAVPAPRPAPLTSDDVPF